MMHGRKGKEKGVYMEVEMRNDEGVGCAGIIEWEIQKLRA